jgi:hypothetical protein
MLGVQPLSEDLYVFGNLLVQVVLPVPLLCHVEVLLVSVATIPCPDRIVRVLDEHTVPAIHLDSGDEWHIEEYVNILMGSVVSLPLVRERQVASTRILDILPMLLPRWLFQWFAPLV